MTTTSARDTGSRYRTVRVASHDYTQVNERAARDRMAALSFATGVNPLDKIVKLTLMTTPRCRSKFWVTFGLVAYLSASALIASAQSASPAGIPAGELVRKAVENEIAANNSSTKHMFRSRRQTPRGSQTRLYIETKQAMAAMLIAINDQPLTPQQQQGEIGHLGWLLSNPEQLRKKQAREKEDADRTLRIVKALPDAFRYDYAGTEAGQPGLGKPGCQLVRLNFRPNPSYSPPTRVEQVLGGMQGYLLIEPEAGRLAKIDGTLFRDISFGWGIIGHLDKGGHFIVTQADVGDGSWEVSEMKLEITGKILLFKSISMQSDEVFSDFRRVDDNLTFAQGVKLLEQEQDKLAHNGHEAESAETKKGPH